MTYLGHYRRITEGHDVTWVRDDHKGTHACHDRNGSLEMVPNPVTLIATNLFGPEEP